MLVFSEQIVSRQRAGFERFKVHDGHCQLDNRDRWVLQDIYRLTLFKLLANHEDSKAGRMITDNLSGIIIFGLQFTLGFVVLMFIWPFLLCCCLCTCCTGSSQYNRKTSKVLLIVLAAGLLLAVGTSIYGTSVNIKV